MKKLLHLFFMAVFFNCMQYAVAQDPFSRLKQAASQKPAQREMLSKVSLSESDRRLKVTNKAAIPFRPFEMVDKNGKRINPDETIEVNGRKEKAKDFFDKLNEIEREQNAKGYSLRNSQQTLVVNVETPSSELDGKVEQLSKSIGRFKSENELENLISLTNIAGNGGLKNSDASSVQTIKGNKGKVWSGNRDLSVTTGSTSNALKVIANRDAKEWSLGVMSTLKAGVNVELLRSAKIYRFNPQSPGSSMSEFKVKATAKVFGGLFDHSLDILSGDVEFFAPADSSKQMTAKGQISVAGITVMSLNESITQSKTYSNFSGVSVDKSFDILIPICCGVSFSGKIGVKGNAGLNYMGSINRTVVTLRAIPVIDLKGYVEAGAAIGPVKFGVGTEITFIHGQVPLTSLIGIAFQNINQIRVLHSYYVGYDLSMLSGRLYGFADFCAPILGCYRVGEVNLFSWGGFNSSGTIAEGDIINDISNL